LLLSRQKRRNAVQLPTPSELKALMSVHQLQCGKASFINPEDVENCIKKGWIESLGYQEYRLTQSGHDIIDGKMSD